MGETLLLITIVSLVVLTIRRARPVILENPVTIQRPGQYHITLAPQLNRAQTFIEQIAGEYAKAQPLRSDSQSCYFEVRDPKVFAKGADCYLLAMTLRGGLLYFQAANPGKSHTDAASHLNTIRDFSDPVMKSHPQAEFIDDQEQRNLRAAIEVAAKQMQVSITALN
jgi:hypothetical protein